MAKRTSKKKKASKTNKKKALKRAPKRKKAPARRKPVKKSVNAFAELAKGSMSGSNELKNLLDKILVHIVKVKGISDNIDQKIESEEKRMFASKSINHKLHAFFQIENLRLASFTDVEGEIKAICPLLNKAYILSQKMGGVIREDYLTLCQDMAHGFNLALLEKNVKKIKRHLS